jgi:uncharacterized protein (DUF983 family)
MMRGIRLRCPRCGEERLFTGLFSMRKQCDHCMLVYEQEPGFFVGAIYINYAVTAVLAMAGFLLLGVYVEVTLRQELVLWITFAVVFPLWFFRYSRSLWLSITHLLTARENAPPKTRSS